MNYDKAVNIFFILISCFGFKFLNVESSLLKIFYIMRLFGANSNLTGFGMNIEPLMIKKPVLLLLLVGYEIMEY